MNRNARFLMVRALLISAALLAPPLAAARSQSTSIEPEPVKMKQPRGFRLLGLSDFAITGMRSAGNVAWHTTNAGPGNTFGFYAGLGVARTRGTRLAPTSYINGFFELQLWMLAARSDWSRARDNIPSLEKVTGGGFNSRTNLQRTAPPELQSITARDGSVGVFHSGVTTERGTGSCRDMSASTNGDIVAGIPVLAISDCPPTWPGGVFGGEHPVADTTWLRKFKASPSTFTFDDWHFTKSERADRLYGSVQTYGATNDFGRENLALLGEVVPGGSGPPKIQGYALGIEWIFNTFTYSVPTVADAMFYKVTLVNKSAEVYGVGIDYDSLYAGVMARPLFSPQTPGIYAVPSKGAVYAVNNNVNGTNCYGPVGGKTFGTNIRPCNLNTDPGRGFAGGAVAMIFLKSPIGDLRNKKFSDPASPFYSPGHPLAGDTLTMNLANMCGVTCYATQIVTGNVRATWGALAEIEADALGGRGQTSSDLTERQYFDLFHTQDWPTRWNPAVPNIGGFNKYVPPGNWDYNKDGKLDTLHLTSCGRSGCAVPFSDTIPGGFPNDMHNTVHGGVGPIKMKAGDTTSFVIAFLSSPDSVSFEASVSNIINLYQSFWLSPEPPCPVKIVSAVPTGGNRQFDTNVRLYFDQSVNNCQDKFLIEQAKAFRASAVASDIRLRVLNPRLVNQIYRRALPAGTLITDTVPVSTAFNNQCGLGAFNAANCRIFVDTATGVVDSLFIFKSCDGGNTFTNSTGSACIPAPARDVAGAATDFPWQAYARAVRDAQGRFPSVFNDGAVTAGLTYTYVVAGASFPGIFSVVDSIGGRITNSTFTIRPKVVNAVSTNTANPNVANVYVPASAQGGSSPTLVNFVTAETDTLAQFNIFSRLSKPLKGTTPITGSLIIADSAEVQIFDADTSVAGITSTTLRLYATQDTAPTGTVVRRAATELAAFTVTETASSLVVIGDTIVRKDSAAGGGTKGKFSFVRYNSRGPKGALIADGRPVYVTDSLPPADITPAGATVRPDFPGLLVSFTPTSSATFRGFRWILPRIGALNTEAYPNLSWINDATIISRDPRSYSHYVTTFGDKEYGPRSPFRIDRANTGALQPAVTASIAARKTVSNTLTDAATAGLINKALGVTNLTLDSLAALKLPFSITNRTTGAAVSIAVLKRDHPANAIFGSGTDTIRVALPSDAWVPGDKLYFIETFQVDSTIRVGTRTVVVQASFQVQTNGGVVDTVVVPVKTTTTRVTWGPAVIGCAGIATCNPIEGIGGTGYTAVSPNEILDVVYYAPVNGLVTFSYTIEPERTGARIANTTRDLGRVRAVPNPYVMFSQYEQTRNTKRMLFTHLPPTGTIRIYTASGQFVQQLTWVESDLEQNCQATTSTTTCEATGDLSWNMRTRENLEIGPGFYVFVVSTKNKGSTAQKLGKFVIIH